MYLINFNTKVHFDSLFQKKKSFENFQELKENFQLK